MRSFVRAFLTASIAVVGAGILIAAPVNADPATDPNPDQGVDEIIRNCRGNEECVRETIEQERECISAACVVRENPLGVEVGADNPKGLSVGAANQTSSDSGPGASDQHPVSPGPSNKNGSGPKASKKNNH